MLLKTADGPVGELVLDRPEKLNALSPALLQDLVDAAAWFDAHSHVKVVVVRGEGRSFCAGADLTAIGRAGSELPDGDENARLHAFDLGRRMATAISAMRALTVVAVHGYCVGGGVVLAAACDIRLAAEDSSFSIPEVDLGIPLAWGGIPRLVRELGPALTKELVLTCRPFDAREAHALRFVNHVVPAADLLDRARAIAARLAEQPSFALTMTKRHVNAVAEEAGSTALSFRDADLLNTALRDRESLARMAAYMGQRS